MVFASKAFFLVSFLVAAVACSPRDVPVASSEQRALINQKGKGKVSTDASKSSFYISKPGMAVHLIERQSEAAAILKILRDESKASQFGYKVLRSTKINRAFSYVLDFSKINDASVDGLQSSVKEYFVADITANDEAQFVARVRAFNSAKMISKNNGDTKIAITEPDREIYFKCSYAGDNLNCHLENYLKGAQVKFYRGNLAETYNFSSTMIGMIGINKNGDVTVEDMDQNFFRIEEKNLEVEFHVTEPITILANDCFPKKLEAKVSGSKPAELHLNEAELVYNDGQTTAKVAIPKCENRPVGFNDLEKLLEIKSN